MALEISEVGIRMRVGGECGDPSSDEEKDRLSETARQQLVADCVRQVLRALQQRRER